MRALLALLDLEIAVPREERRIERELRRHRKIAGRLVAEIAAQLEGVPPAPHEILTLARALEAASIAQRTASGSLLGLARIRVERARAAIADAGDEVEPVADEVH